MFDQNISPPDALSGLCRDSYSLEEIEQLYEALLCKHRVFDFEVFPNGLFPAIGKGSPTEMTSGYRAVWIRDNVHIAYAHFIAGGHVGRQTAVRNATALASFFETQRNRFLAVISDRDVATNSMNRPHIRFDGETVTEISKKWPHAQNDALGCFAWFFCTLLRHRTFEVTPSQQELLWNMVLYLKAIAYWKDEDSGHWEEQMKISASSIGAVNAGLAEYRKLLDSPNFSLDAASQKEEVDELLSIGIDAVNRILPLECNQQDPMKFRRHDAALLFLIDPLDTVAPDIADRILLDVATHLQGERGISRYAEDSYWGPDYRTIPEEKRTIDLSEDIIQRSAFSVHGKEAKWCIFDSVISSAYGKKFCLTGDELFLNLQTKYFNRALTQLVESQEDKDKLLIPEAYFMEQGQYVPNDHLPLQWAHANLWRAVHGMVKSIAKAALQD